MRIALSFGVGAPLACLLVAQVAGAQPSAGNVAAAQTLYDEARKLMKEQKWADACPKLEESERIDPSPGTEFHLADCYAHTGRTASAWARFVALADSLKVSGQKEREGVARSSAAALEPKLTRLVLTVPDAARVPGLEITRDGEVVREAQWGSAVAVDEGQHVIQASAPKHKTWQTTADTYGEGKTLSVEVPSLADASDRPAVASETRRSSLPVESPSRGWGTQRILAVVLGGVGVVGLGVGGYFGLVSISKHSDYQSHCTGSVCDATGVQLHDDAVTAGDVSTVAMAVGAVALAAGVTLWLTAPPRTPSTSGGAALFVGPGMLGARGAW